MARKQSALTGFKEADSIPPKRRASWAYKVLDEFMDDGRAIIYCDFEDDRKAAMKQAALAKEIKAEGSSFAGKVNVERRANKIYLERL